MDNSFDKLNNEFADKSGGGFLYWFWLVLSFVFEIAGLIVGIYALLPGHNRYLSLLTLLGGLFGLQTRSWAKARKGGANLAMTVSLVAGLAVAVFACVILYIVLPYVNG